MQAEVFVVDNASADGSIEMVKEKFPWVTCIANHQNLGFSKANNLAIKQAKGKYVLLLNPDTVVQEDTFVKCYDFMEKHPQAGALGVYMVDGKGSYLPESKRGLPSPWVAFYKIIGLSKLFPRSHTFGRYHLGYLDKNQTWEVDVLSGAFMWLRKSAIDQVGYLDEDYFMYGEDIDLSYRIQKAGFKNYYFSDTRIIHYKGESTKKSSVNYVLVFYGAMIIFAQKHFKGAYAGAFTALIQLAIYARALAAIGMRAFKASYKWVTDALGIYMGLYGLKWFWESQVKDAEGYYPPEFTYYVLPAYVCAWLTAIYFSGGYDKPFKPYRIVRGAIVGTLLISAVSNFFDSYRYSKAIILLGGVWVILCVVTMHYVWQFLKYKRLNFSGTLHKKAIVVGSPQESERVIRLLKNTSANAEVLGFVATQPGGIKHELCIGEIHRLKDILKLYKPDEVIFCARNIAAAEIIELMASLEQPNLDFKMVPDNSNFVIGSSSKNIQGELYTLEVHLRINEPTQKRNKRVIDVGVAVALLALLPVVFWWVKKPVGLIKNSVEVLLGYKSWVGFAPDNSQSLPAIKKGVLNPISEFKDIDTDPATTHKLNLLYAKDYHTAVDIGIILNNFTQLGN